MSTSRLERMREAVRSLYDRNRQRGTAPWCGRDYDFVCPSMGTYPFQWFWDSCFHAVALARFDPERARIEMRSLLANAQPDGFVAHVTFWQREKYEEMLSTYSIAYRTPYLSDCIQPPLLAEGVAAGAQGDGGDAYLTEVLPAVRRYYDWLDRVRDPDRDGLIATAWERVAGPYAEVGRDPDRMFGLDLFVVEDVLVNSIYAENERVLAELLERTGDRADAEEMRRRARRTTTALVDKCYDRDAGLFFDLAGADEEMLRTNSVSSLMPLLLPDLPAPIAATLIDHLGDPREYAAPFPVPSVAMNVPSFSAGPVGKLVWRGPSWMNTNWYLSRGLRRHGRPDVAAMIEDRSARLVEDHGFREYYNPITGEGAGAQDFSWTGIVVDMLARREGEA